MWQSAEASVMPDGRRAVLGAEKIEPRQCVFLRTLRVSNRLRLRGVLRCTTPRATEETSDS